MEGFNKGMESAMSMLVLLVTFIFFATREDLDLTVLLISVVLTIIFVAAVIASCEIEDYFKKKNKNRIE